MKFPNCMGFVKFGTVLCCVAMFCSLVSLSSLQRTGLYPYVHRVKLYENYVWYTIACIQLSMRVTKKDSQYK